MSDNWLIVIPEDPLAIPPPERRTAAFELLRQLLPDSEEREIKVSGDPEFVWCGENAEGIYCPACRADLGSWLSEQLNRWWDGDRRSLAAETPCCHRTISLNDLDYDGPQGFACVAFEFMNPGADLEPSARVAVEEALGMPVRIVWRHL